MKSESQKHSSPTTFLTKYPSITFLPDQIEVKPQGYFTFINRFDA